MGNQQHINGAAAELFVASRLASLGYAIYYPLMTQSRADLVVEKDGVFKKVQVKKATKGAANGSDFIQIRLGGCGRNQYVDGDFDLLAMVYENRVWLLPWEFVKGNTSMSFSIFGKGTPRRDITQFELPNSHAP